MTTPPPMPQPPLGGLISIDRKKVELCVNTGGFSLWRTPLFGSSILTIDNTGKRVTVTRLAVLGLFALGAKKKSGDVTVIVVGKNGDSTSIKVKAGKAQAVITWAVQFNAWMEANG